MYDLWLSTKTTERVFSGNVSNPSWVGEPKNQKNSREATRRQARCAFSRTSLQQKKKNSTDNRQQTPQKNEIIILDKTHKTHTKNVIHEEYYNRAEDTIVYSL